MKRIIVLMLSLTLVFSGCGQSNLKTDTLIENRGSEVDLVGTDPNQLRDNEKQDRNIEEIRETYFEVDDGLGDMEVNFASLNDVALLQYVQDNVYSDLSAQLSSEDYIIEGVDTIFISKEYIEEQDYNSQSNIYFGYTLEEIDAQFQGARYVFSLDEEGNTNVESFEEYDDTYKQVIKNVAIGSGVILVCVTVSVVTAGMGAPACVSMVFAAAAKTGTAFALSSGVISSVAAGTVTAIQNGNMEEVVKSAALQGSEGFKWGAITGVVTGGASKSLALYKSATTIPTPRQSELKVLERTKGAKEQISYLSGKEVSLSTQGATRPDVVIKNADGTIQAIEVKNYNLANASNRDELYRELERQVTSRVTNLPKGSTQKIVLDVRGRNFADELIEMVMKNIKLRCGDIYPDIPIEALAY